jgi:hypothetical protein
VSRPVGEVLADVGVAHDGARVDDEDPRTGDLLLIVPNSVELADGAVAIREQRENGRTSFSIIARFCSGESTERLEVPAVADQLPLAVRSPVAAIEDEDRRPGGRRQAHGALALVGEGGTKVAAN